MVAELRVVVTGAGGQIGYSILQPLAMGLAFGPHQPVHIVMFDLPVVEDVLKGVQMELEDLASPVLMGTTVATSGEVAFKDADFVICLAGLIPLEKDMTRDMLTEKNAPIYQQHGSLVDKHAKKTCKVLVVANPCNTLCYIMAQSAPSIPKANFSSMSRLDHNRTRSIVARALAVSTEHVKHVCVWGNHANSMVPDVSRATACIDGKCEKVETKIAPQKFKDEFVPVIRGRALEIVRLRKRTSALSSAMAAIDHLRDWFLGTPEGHFSSMGVWSDGSYGAPKEVFFSFPCICKGGQWQIAKDLQISPSLQEQIKATGDDLLGEKSRLKL